MQRVLEKFAEDICDCHIHYGQFREDYYDPNQLIHWFDELGIDKVGVMPISFMSDFKSDERIVASLPKERFIPYLWVTPEMVDIDPTLNSYDSINFKVIKIHAYARMDWDSFPDKIRTVIQAAYKRKVPIMFHTGGWRGSNAIQFYKFCRDFPSVDFILAHGRPISQTITVLKGAKNAYVDNSFMTIDSMKMICEAGLSQRIIFGTDYPIMKTFWPEIDIIDWYKNHIEELIKIFGEKAFMIWANENFYKLVIN
ncbi:MAG: amidohydrolase family protein [Bacteroidales bacterium]|jgi:hypothetical protein